MDIRLWDLDSGRCLRVLRGHSKVVERVAWSRDEQSILSPSFDRTVRSWNLETGECLRVLEGHRAGVKQVVYTVTRAPPCHVTGAAKSVDGLCRHRGQVLW